MSEIQVEKHLFNFSDNDNLDGKDSYKAIDESPRSGTDKEQVKRLQAPHYLMTFSVSEQRCIIDIDKFILPLLNFFIFELLLCLLVLNLF